MIRSTPAGPDCARAWEAMPWILQDNASQDQRTWFASHIAECDDCRNEFAVQERLHRAMALEPDVTVDPEAGLGRLFARLDVDDPQRAPAPRATGTSWILRTLAAAVLVQAVGIGVLGMKVWSGEHAPSYRTLSEASAPMPKGAIHVVPDKAMKVSEWNALLHDQHLSVVGGPNGVGAYTVLPDDASASSQVLAQHLRAVPGIRFAEPATGTP